MDVDADHYRVLGLPSGEEGFKLTKKQISKAYKQKALELHPDKRPNDPNAHINFQRLKSSYELLNDDKARELFHDLLRVKLERYARAAQRDSKRQKMVSDLEERERAAFAVDSVSKVREEEEVIARKLQQEMARIRAMHATKGASSMSTPKSETVGERKDTEINVDREKMLKVSWEKGGEDYTAVSLKELFSKFGEVEDIVISNSKKRRSALLQMATKEAAVEAARNAYGHISNPLLVLPLKQASATVYSSTHPHVKSDHFNNLVGVGYKAYEDSVLEKLQKIVAAKSKA